MDKAGDEIINEIGDGIVGRAEGGIVDRINGKTRNEYDWGYII